MLEKLADGLWADARPFRAGPFLELGTRMSVVRLADGGLFLHSLVEIDAETRAALEALGPVHHLVAGNQLHHLYLASALKAFPQAEVWGPPGLAEKRKDLGFEGVLGDEAPAAWRTDLEQLALRGIPRMNEVAFLHRASRTLLVTDLCFNVRHSESLATRLFMRANGVYGRFGPSRLLRALVRDRPALRASVERILTWDFDRVVVTHGDVLERGGKDALRAGFAWLL
jgi:hypothetical protein